MSENDCSTGRQCRKCQQDLPGGAFCRNPFGAGGLDPWCKTCRATHNREQRQAAKADGSWVIAARAAADRFWALVARGAPGDCWPWQGARRANGYGQVTIAGGAMKAHRVAFAIAVDDPGDRVVMHACNNPICVNPAHLSIGNQRDNARYMVACGRHGGAKLAPSDIPTIRMRAAMGERQSDIAADYGVNQPAISAIVTGRNWSHVG